MKNNTKAQSDNTMWIIIAFVVVILAVLLAFLLTGKIAGIGNKIIMSFG